MDAKNPGTAPAQPASWWWNPGINSAHLGLEDAQLRLGALYPQRRLAADERVGGRMDRADAHPREAL